MPLGRGMAELHASDRLAESQTQSPPEAIPDIRSVRYAELADEICRRNSWRRLRPGIYGEDACLQDIEGGDPPSPIPHRLIRKSIFHHLHALPAEGHREAVQLLIQGKSEHGQKRGPIGRRIFYYSWNIVPRLRRCIMFHSYP